MTTSATRAPDAKLSSYSASIYWEMLEATPGIEPGYADLQSAYYVHNTLN
jgi:hypothetical protein